jgi:hypothetical protein
VESQGRRDMYEDNLSSVVVILKHSRASLGTVMSDHWSIGALVQKNEIVYNRIHRGLKPDYKLSQDKIERLE